MTDAAPDVCLPDPPVHLSPPTTTNLFDAGGPHGEFASRISIAGGSMKVRARVPHQGERVREGPDRAPVPADEQGPDGAPTPDLMGYHTARDPELLGVREAYTLHDRMFAPTDSWTLPAHLFLVSGWSARCPVPDDPMACVSNQRNPGSAPA